MDYTCDVCNYATKSIIRYNRHIISDKHVKNVAVRHVHAHNDGKQKQPNCTCGAVEELRKTKQELNELHFNNNATFYELQITMTELMLDNENKSPIYRINPEHYTEEYKATLRKQATDICKKKFDDELGKEKSDKVFALYLSAKEKNKSSLLNNTTTS
jgi:hypothetical protein